MSLEEYAGFEGNVPEVEYGRGIRVLVGQGEYETERWCEREIIVRLEGTSLKGRCCMIELRGRQGNRPPLRCDGDGGEG